MGLGAQTYSLVSGNQRNMFLIFQCFSTKHMIIYKLKFSFYTVILGNSTYSELILLYTTSKSVFNFRLSICTKETLNANRCLCSTLPIQTISCPRNVTNREFFYVLAPITCEQKSYAFIIRYSFGFYNSKEDFTIPRIFHVMFKYYPSFSPTNLHCFERSFVSHTFQVFRLSFLNFSS